MMKYAVVFYPSHNRVYFQSSIDMAEAELRAVRSLLNARVDEINLNYFGAIPLLFFETDRDLSPKDIEQIYSLSFCYLLFKRSDDGSMLPVSSQVNRRFDNDINTILKYSGKTNEVFTELLINVAMSVCQTDNKYRPTLLDPVCGRGTTLLAALARGCSCSGIEVEKKSVHEFNLFLKRYLRENAWKFKIERSGINNATAANCEIFMYRMGENKEVLLSDQVLTLKLVRGDTRHARQYFKKCSFDLIVGDLPYGIHHGHTLPQGIIRDPLPLLRSALPGWLPLLKPNGVIALAWNKRMMSRTDCEELFTENGLTLFDDAPYNKFEHAVDHSILRDIIVGIKKP